MPRVARFLAPAFRPALLFFGLLALCGCSLLPRQEAASTDPAPVSSGAAAEVQRDAFTVEVRAPDPVRAELTRHLEIQRYRQVQDLQAAEVSRLMVAAEANARELLGTLGYFRPHLVLELKETPEDRRAPRAVVITVEPGPPSRIRQVLIDFSGPVSAGDATDASQREAIRRNWSLQPGQVFSQSGWDAAKSAGLRALSAKRYPTARITASRAEIDADQDSARLSVGYESGPLYRFGLLDVRGAERYDADAARRIARLPTGADYDQQALLDAQQRLASSGYYDSVFLTLDTEAGFPPFTPVIAQVREAPLQKVVLGAGFTTDSGPRVSVDHIHNRMPLLGWRAVSKLSVDRDTQLLSTDWNGVPADSGWRWTASGQLKRELSGSYDVESGRLRGGLSRASDHIDRAWYLQYDRSHYLGNDTGVEPPPSASALSLNWSWTGRYFNDPVGPTRGWGLALELGAGYTLTGERRPFTRSQVRWMGIIPLDWDVAGGEPAQAGSDAAPRTARTSRLALRAEFGAVVARDSARVPSTLQFLTGGDTTVRGYSYRSLGTTDASGATVAGRYLGVASVEWQRPVVWNGRLSDWESTVFVDAGNVADKPRELGKLKVGIGAGARWRSPFGPVQADLAYGLETRKFRLHLRLGFTF